ncbi:MAG: hypothetical protein DHS20C02_04240 [Micavibrio sp.]|nr:MAG: hypothetical protein DHS20C02_04240 [Micavibrio sp.]
MPIESHEDHQNAANTGSGYDGDLEVDTIQGMSLKGPYGRAVASICGISLLLLLGTTSLGMAVFGSPAQGAAATAGLVLTNDGSPSNAL